MISQDYAALAAVAPLLGFASYVRDTFRGRARPNRVSWSLWAAAPMIAFVAELTDGTTLRVALVTFALGAGPALAVLASFARPGAKRERDRLTWFDYACGTSGVLALALWAITGRPGLAISFAIAAELFAGLPTIVKSWSHPESETAGTYLASGAGSGITLLTIGNWRFASYGFPLAVTTECAVILALIMLRPQPHHGSPVLLAHAYRPRHRARRGSYRRHRHGGQRAAPHTHHAAGASLRSAG